MKGLYVFAVAPDGAPADNEIIRRLESEQERRQALYSLHVTRITLTDNYTERQDDDGEWLLAAGKDGALADPDAAGELIHRGATQVLSQMGEKGEALPNLVYIACDSRSAVAMIEIARLMADHSGRMFSSLCHLIVALDQLTPYRDGGVARLMSVLRNISDRTPRFYTSLYMLPWEASKRANTIGVIDALTKAMVIGDRNAILTRPNVAQSPMWLETAAVARLEAPVEQIRQIIFAFIADRFYDETLKKALEGTSVFPTDLSSRAERRSDEIANRFRKGAGTLALQPLTSLYEVMPEKDPKPGLKAMDDMSPDQAWQIIRDLYGEDQYEAFRAMLDTDRDAIHRRYAGLMSDVSRQLVECAAEVAAEAQADLGQARLICQTMSRRVQDAPMRSTPPDEEPQYPRFSPFEGRDAREARASAKLRQGCLAAVYNEAKRELTGAHREIRRDALSDATRAAEQYLRDFTTAFGAYFDQARAMRRVGSANIYEPKLNDAYTGWCVRHIEELDMVRPSDLYALLRDIPWGESSDDAARRACDEIIEKCRRAAEDAVRRISASIERFFREISFRARQMSMTGYDEDRLNGSVVEYLLAQPARPDLLVMASADNVFSTPDARAFIFHRSVQDASDRVAAIAQDSGISVIADPFEDGVSMLVKYSGNFLDQTVVYHNNADAESAQ